MRRWITFHALDFGCLVFPGSVPVDSWGKIFRTRQRLGWVVSASCITMTGGVMFGLNCSKAWIRIQAGEYIPIILTTQVLCALTLNLKDFHDVSFLMLSLRWPFNTFALDSCFGLKGRRRWLKPLFNCIMSRSFFDRFTCSGKDFYIL